MVLTIMKVYFILIVIITICYAIRHFVFAYNRMFGRPRMFYSDIYDSETPFISILIPMHNEEKVAGHVLESLLKCSYDRDRMEIIPINDNSTDRTKEILDRYHSRYPFIRPHHRINTEERGKPVALNEAMEFARGDVIMVFDADYRPPDGILSALATTFSDPEAGAVMGRVIPQNITVNQLTRLINLERSGGYQADQQARYNLRVMPQYGGTVGAFRKDLIIKTGGFNPNVLAEDTEITYRLYTKGYKVLYANGAECYEEAPETWEVRGRQVRRWSRGHNAVMFRYMFPMLFSKHMSIREKVDGLMLLTVYSMPFLFALALIDTIALFFLGEMNIFIGWWAVLFVGVYNSYGNFAPFYEITTALIVDGIRLDAKILPLLTFNFYFYIWNIGLGFIDAIADIFTHRRVVWAKTERFRKSSPDDAGKSIMS